MAETSREKSTRSTQERKKTWRRPSMLEAPEAKPGMHQRWVRKNLRNDADDMNVVRRIREGYEPVKSEDAPDWVSPSIEDGKHAGVISTGDLILMEIPEEMAKQRTDYYQSMTDRMMEGVNRELRGQSTAEMPVSDTSKTEVEMGNRNKEVSFQKDEEE